jgi:hypothetical protein
MLRGTTWSRHIDTRPTGRGRRLLSYEGRGNQSASLAAAEETVDQDHGMQTGEGGGGGREFFNQENGIGSFFRWAISGTGHRKFVQIVNAEHTASQSKYVGAWRPSFSGVAAGAFAVGLVAVGLSSVHSWRRGKSYLYIWR